MLEYLGYSRFSRKSLEGKKVYYRVRWAPHEERVGTIARVKDFVLWLGCACLHHDDIVSMREVES